MQLENFGTGWVEKKRCQIRSKGKMNYSLPMNLVLGVMEK